MSSVLVIDNYDSFTYNLVQYLGELGEQPLVHRNDAMTVDEMGELRPQAIVISPGPCTPAEAGISVPLVQRWGAEIPILGVCLGHQAIGEAYGGGSVRARRVMHGKTSRSRTMARGCSRAPVAARGHALPLAHGGIGIVARRSLRSWLARSMITRRSTPCATGHTRSGGCRFHPESMLTKTGMASHARNFLTLAASPSRRDVRRRNTPESVRCLHLIRGCSSFRGVNLCMPRHRAPAAVPRMSDLAVIPARLGATGSSKTAATSRR